MQWIQAGIGVLNNCCTLEGSHINSLAATR